MGRGLVVSLFVVSCGGSPPPSKPATQAATPAPQPCAPDAASAPTDAKPKMASLQGEVKRCYALATGGASDVKVEVTVSESGVVTEARVLSDGGAPAQSRTCLVNAFKGQKFGKFCGPDVSIAWTYALR